jgi:hypothetical protein
MLLISCTNVPTPKSGATIRCRKASSLPWSGRNRVCWLSSNQLDLDSEGRQLRQNKCQQRRIPRKTIEIFDHQPFDPAVARMLQQHFHIRSDLKTGYATVGIEMVHLHRERAGSFGA